MNLVEVADHLLEAKLMVEVTPCEIRAIVLIELDRLDFISDEAILLLLNQSLFQRPLLLCEDLLPVDVGGQTSWGSINRVALLNSTSDPVEFLDTELLPNRVLSVKELLGALIIVGERRRLSQDVLLDLIVKIWELVHVLAAAVILLGL